MQHDRNCVVFVFKCPKHSEGHLPCDIFGTDLAERNVLTKHFSRVGTVKNRPVVGWLRNPPSWVGGFYVLKPGLFRKTEFFLKKYVSGRFVKNKKYIFLKTSG